MSQLSLISSADRTDEDWNSDDWETPDWLGKYIGKVLVDPLEFCLEPAAGTGQIARYLPYGSHCIELNPDRYEAGNFSNPDKIWFAGDFLAPSNRPDSVEGKYDAIVTNPPFRKGIEFISRSLQLLKGLDSRLLFLLPVDYFQSLGRFKQFKSLDAHIHCTYPIVGRVAYLKQGTPEKGRQIYDAVFDIRPGRSGGTQFITQ